MLKSSSLLLNSKHLVLSSISKVVRKSSYAGLVNLNTRRPSHYPTNYLISNNLHSSTQLYFIKNTNNDSNQGSTTSKTETPKINLSQMQTPKSALSDDLKSILSSISVEDTNEPNKTTSQSDAKSDDSNKKKGIFATMFSRENSWKVTLVFFSSMFGFCIVYVLTNWGKKLTLVKSFLISLINKS